VSEIRSRKVRKILRLEARAQRLLARYDRAMRKVEPARTRAEALLREVRAIEYTLTGGQLGELRRWRGRRP
jgi:hypothetical protein